MQFTGCTPASRPRPEGPRSCQRHDSGGRPRSAPPGKRCHHAGPDYGLLVAPVPAGPCRKNGRRRDRAASRASARRSSGRTRLITLRIGAPLGLSEPVLEAIVSPRGVVVVVRRRLSPEVHGFDPRSPLSHPSYHGSRSVDRPLGLPASGLGHRDVVQRVQRVRERLVLAPSVFRRLARSRFWASFRSFVSSVVGAWPSRAVRDFPRGLGKLREAFPAHALALRSG